MTFLRIVMTAALLTGGSALAENPHVRYRLRELRPAGTSAYDEPIQSARREYFKFQNATGTHYLIYDESKSSVPVTTMQDIRAALATPGLVCSADLDCKESAFCTGSCRNFYYETSNLPAQLEPTDRNHCVIADFHCAHAQAGGAKP